MFILTDSALWCPCLCPAPGGDVLSFLPHPEVSFPGHSASPPHTHCAYCPPWSSSLLPFPLIAPHPLGPHLYISAGHPLLRAFTAPNLPSTLGLGRAFFHLPNLQAPHTAGSGWDCGQLKEALAGGFRLGDPKRPAVCRPASPVYTHCWPTSTEPQSPTQMPSLTGVGRVARLPFPPEPSL